tara:strand:+ start:11 stop:697 length:687 start_codon:yes stop_codon:yes gene_type:complete
MKSKRSVLVTICTKNPQLCYLLENIDYFRNLLGDRKYLISIIDSDSNILSAYKELEKKKKKEEKKYSQVNIHYSKNRHYEYGAYKYSYQMYPNYDIYVCIQDTVLFTKKINIKHVSNEQAYIYKHHSGFNLDRQSIPFSMRVLKSSPFPYPDYANDPSVRTFPMCQHCSFITTKKNMSGIFETLTIPPSDKLGSRSYERLFGLYFLFKNIKIINLRQLKVKKVHRKRK